MLWCCGQVLCHLGERITFCVVFSPVPTGFFGFQHVWPDENSCLFIPPSLPTHFWSSHLCFGVLAELGGQTRGGSSFCFGRNVPCPFALLLLCLFFVSGKEGRRLCYRVYFWQEVGKM